MPQTQTHTFTPPPNPSTPGTAQWLYDEIMRHIEPDLLTTVMPHHAEMYADETMEQRVKRMEAYDKAFAIFDSVAAKFEKEFHKEIRAMRKDAHAEAAHTEKRERNRKLEDIESQLDDA